ncbi:glycoside hydrolase superfamily [Roridomyces roridus]|uniref:Alpha-amylase n=1 Tax=Roridomyces roridus TaxID=1738132 RepID=A0AAD7FY77_9AGAR|nr:glycoside hydrolase superfamily [Roridomyces roridus]
MEHITGTQWWTDYQPVSYIIKSKRGDRTQFSNMVSTCANAGVGIIVDVILNHMTSGEGTGIAGSTYSKYNYPAVPYTASDFHYCAGNGVAGGIVDYNNVTNIRFCELSNLADLAQEQSGVQASMKAYLADLVSLGAAGFRVDAAKHMEPQDLSAIFQGLSGSPYFTQEVPGDSDASNPSQYVGNGDVIEFGATQYVMEAFLGTSGSVSNLVTPTPMGTSWDLIASDAANYIMANQDTERGTTSLNVNSPNNAYTLSAIFMLGFNYGTPTVFSGYDFTDFDAGAPQDSDGFTNAVTCYEGGFRCEHRWIAISNMVAFHNAAQGQDLRDVMVGTAQQVAFGRGSAGFLVINNDGNAWSATFKTSLPAGSYCDVIHDTTSDPTTCSDPGTNYNVGQDGTFTASVGAYDALALFAA